MTRIPTHRPPTHPGEILLEEFLKPIGITQQQLAEAIHLPYQQTYQQINEIINGDRGIGPSTALRLARYFKMSPDFWLNNQQGWDLYHAQLAEVDVLESIQPIES
jgi:antitoxin HigA-1